MTRYLFIFHDPDYARIPIGQPYPLIRQELCDFQHRERSSIGSNDWTGRNSSLLYSAIYHRENS